MPPVELSQRQFGRLRQFRRVHASPGQLAWRGGNREGSGGRLALERRPRRAPSARPFLGSDLPRVLLASKSKDPKQLDSALESLHTGCAVCHINEKVEHFKDAVDRIKERASQDRLSFGDASIAEQASE